MRREGFQFASAFNVVQLWQLLLMCHTYLFITSVCVLSSCWKQTGKSWAVAKEIMGCGKGIVKKERFPNSVTCGRRRIQNPRGTGFAPKIGMYHGIYMVLQTAH